MRVQCAGLRPRRGLRTPARIGVPEVRNTIPAPSGTRSRQAAGSPGHTGPYVKVGGQDRFLPLMAVPVRAGTGHMTRPGGADEPGGVGNRGPGKPALAELASARRRVAGVGGAGREDGDGARGGAVVDGTVVPGVHPSGGYRTGPISASASSA